MKLILMINQNWKRFRSVRIRSGSRYL